MVFFALFCCQVVELEVGFVYMFFFSALFMSLLRLRGDIGI